MPARAALLALVLASGASLSPEARAQFPLEWEPVESANAALPASIRVFRSVTQGVPAWYVRADPADLSWRLAAVRGASGGATVPTYAADAGALVAVNGGYFGGGQSFSLVLDRGQTFSSNIAALTRDGQTYYPTRGAFGISEARVPDVAWVYNVGGVQTAYGVPNANAEGAAPEPRPTDSFPAGARPWEAWTGIGGGPVLVEGGAVRLTWEEEVFFGGSGVDLTSARARTAAGYDARGRLLLFTAAENRGLRLRELAEVMVAIGAVEAVNLDGGGSSALVAGGETLKPSSRPVASALMIVPASGEAETVLDTGSPGYEESGAWFESSNTPFYGSTPARLLEAGATGRAVFRFSGIAEGAYALDAWWVPAPNRARDTPFTVYQDGQPTTLRVDQSDPDTAGRWNEIATPVLASGDSLVITADASAGAGATFVVADAVRLRLLSTPAAEPAPDRPLAVAAAPNPARGRVTVRLALPAPGPVRVAVVDALGREVRLWRGALAAGAQRVEVGLGGLAPGAYAVRAEGAGVAGTARFTLVR